MNYICRSLFLFLISFDSAFSGVTVSSYNLPDQSDNSILQNVKRTFVFSDFMIQKNEIAFKQKIFYAPENNFFDFCCLCPHEKSIQPRSNFVILNLKNKKVSTYKSYNNYQKMFNSEEFKMITTQSAHMYNCIGRPLDESIFLEKPNDDTPPENPCKVYARNASDTLLIGSVTVYIDPYTKKTKFYLWENIEKEMQKLISIKELIDLDKKAQLIVKIFFISEKVALIFFNDGSIIKLDVSLKV